MKNSLIYVKNLYNSYKPYGIYSPIAVREKMKSIVSVYAFNTLSRLGLVFAGIAGLLACDRHQVQPMQEIGGSEQASGISITAANTVPTEPVVAKSLTQIASQTNFRAETAGESQPVPEYAQDFVGRYCAKIQCDGRFVPCLEGTAEFILTLLADGTVHRSIVQHGKIFIDNSKNSDDGNITYRKDRWIVNPERTELIIQRKEGASFYYIIKNSNQLVMNLEKIHSEKETINQELFERGYPAPSKAYVLSKKDNFPPQ